MFSYKSFGYAWRGITLAWKQEANFRFQVGAAIVVVVFSCFFPLTVVERSLLSLVIALVLILELVNTALERLLEILKPGLHPTISAVKDLMAGAVLLAALGALVVGVLIFSPYLGSGLK